MSFASFSQLNPFDLQHRLSKEERSVQQSEISTTEPVSEQTIIDSSLKSQTNSATEQDSTKQRSSVSNSEAVDSTVKRSFLNPFTKEDVITETLEETIDKTPESSIDKPIFQKNSLFLFIVLLAITLLTTVTITTNRHLANRIVRAVFNDNYLNLVLREQRNYIAMHYYALYAVFSVNAGLFLYFAFSHLSGQSNMSTLWKCVLFVVCVYTVRHLFLNYLAEIYAFKKEMKQFSFTILIFNIFVGLVLLPINMFIAFSPSAISITFIYIGLFVLGLTFVFRQLRGLFIASQFIFENYFYFFIYLCAFELSPILLLMKYGGGYLT